MSRIAVALCLSIALPSIAAADDRDDRHEVGRDRRELHDDLHDARRAEWLLHEYDRLVALHDGRALDQLENRVALALDDELRDADRDTAAAAHDLRRADEEVREDRSDLERDRLQGGGAAGDFRELWKDRHSQENERHDFLAQADYRKRIIALRDQWSRLRGRYSREHLRSKHDLLEELVRLSRYEIRMDEQQLHEDHDKLRHD
ncbi:MAG TPA: hypothetical protein VFG59_19310 [Anaeromyxobacter sp.]|nr:hypothetical protein [Anaeromyxobacter sp.]